MISAAVLISGLAVALSLAYDWPAGLILILASLVAAGAVALWTEDMMSEIKRRIEDAAEMLDIDAGKLTELLLGDYFGDSVPAEPVTFATVCHQCGRAVVNTASRGHVHDITGRVECSSRDQNIWQGLL